jgi:hypothetical protein
MVLDEFNNLIQSFIDINEYPIRDNPYIFNQALTLQVNEIYTDKHVNMFLPEFLEALCRAVDKASPIPPGENKDEWPMSRRQAQPLINKLENILPVLIKLITHPDLKNLKDKFPMPLKDLVTGLYTPNYENPFYQGYIIKPGLKKKETAKPTAPAPTTTNAGDNANKTQENSMNATGEIKPEENTVNEEPNEEEKEKENNGEGEGEIRIEDNKEEEEEKNNNEEVNENDDKKEGEENKENNENETNEKNNEEVANTNTNENAQAETST